MKDIYQLLEQLDDPTNPFLQRYDRQGRLIPFSAYVRLSNDPTYVCVAKNTIRQGPHEVRVQTVWQGHGRIPSYPQGESSLFETSVECSNGRYEHHYATECEAIEGHRSVVEAIRGGRPLPFPDDSLGAVLGYVRGLLEEAVSEIGAILKVD